MDERTRILHAGPDREPHTGASSIPTAQAPTFARQDPERLGGQGALIAGVAGARSQGVGRRLSVVHGSAGAEAAADLTEDVRDAPAEARATNTGRPAPAAGAPQLTRKETHNGQNL